MQAADSSLALLLALGAAHGVNPAMGWLFAVSLGLQEQRRSAICRALLPLALGHALAIGAAVSVAATLGIIVPIPVLKALAAAALLGFGVWHLTRNWHPRLRGMRVGVGDLAAWSFLMASAHGAGLMVVPWVLSGSGAVGAHDHHAENLGHALAAGLPHIPSAGLMATVVHTVGYLAVAGAIAFVVYEKLGLRLLRKAWVNLNLIWAGALVVTAVLTLVI
jgi:hypothetical protein